MTEEQIERAVERKFNSLDARFMTTGSTMTQAEYDAASAEISRWAESEYWFVSKDRSMTKQYCPCKDDKPDPCPLCGATVAGDDPRRGICQYPEAPPIDYGLRLVLVDRDTGGII